MIWLFRRSCPPIPPVPPGHPKDLVLKLKKLEVLMELHQSAAPVKGCLASTLQEEWKKNHLDAMTFRENSFVLHLIGSGV